MPSRASRAVEIASIVLIGLGVLVGGWNLLLGIARYHGVAALVLAVLCAMQLAALLRNFAAGGPLAGLRASRDVAFVAAILAALIFVVAPQRWAIGACIAALEFAIVLELLARLAPPPPAAE